MIVLGSKIRLLVRGGLVDVILVSLKETSNGVWTLVVEGDDGAQWSEVLSNEEMDAITVLDLQNMLKQELPAGQSDEEVLSVSGIAQLNIRALIMSVLGVVVVIAALIIAFSTGDNGSTKDAEATKIVDDFATDGELNGRLFGEKSLDLNWRVVYGDWSIESGELLSTQRNSSSLALLDLGSSPKSFEVDFRAVTGYSGIVFLYEDELNYWKLIAMKDYATWNLVQVKNGGVPQFKGNTGLTNLQDVKVSVLLNQEDLNQQELTVLIDGEELLRIPMAGVTSQSSVGLFQPGRTSITSVDGKFVVDSLSVGIS